MNWNQNNYFKALNCLGCRHERGFFKIALNSIIRKIHLNYFSMLYGGK